MSGSGGLQPIPLSAHPPLRPSHSPPIPLPPIPLSTHPTLSPSHSPPIPLSAHPTLHPSHSPPLPLSAHPTRTRVFRHTPSVVRSRRATLRSTSRSSFSDPALTPIQPARAHALQPSQGAFGLDCEARLQWDPMTAPQLQPLHAASRDEDDEDAGSIACAACMAACASPRDSSHGIQEMEPADGGMGEPSTPVGTSGVRTALQTASGSGPYHGGPPGSFLGPGAAQDTADRPLCA